MFDLSTLYLLFKIVLLLIIFIICKTVYEYVYIPYRYRVTYGKYDNVKISEKSSVFLGDFSLIMQNKKDKKSMFHHYIEESLENKGIDIRLNFFGSLIAFSLCSTKAMDEFEKLQPSTIDRDEQRDSPLIKFLAGSFVTTRSDERWAKRRKEMIKMVGINSCSKHIPMMIETIDKHIEACPLNEEISLTEMFTAVTFEIITKIFFGQDIIEEMEKMEYICPHTGDKSMLKFHEFFPKCIHEHFDGFFNIKSKIFSFLAEYDLIDPYKTNAKNTNT